MYVMCIGWVSSRVFIKRGKHSNCQIERADNMYIVGLDTRFVGEGIVLYKSNHSNKRCLGVLPQEIFEIYDL